MAPTLKSIMMMVDGVVTLNAKLSNLTMFNAMEQLWDFNNNVIIETKKPDHVIPTPLMNTEILGQADHTLMPAKITGNNDF